MPAQTYKIQCSKVWGGVEPVGLDLSAKNVNVSLYSTASGGKRGGDIYYMSVCSADVLTYMVVADVRDEGAIRGSLARMVGATKLRGESMFVRRLMPQEDKLDLTHIAHGDLAALASTLGALLGRAHRRGSTKLPPKPWSPGARAAIVDHAITLAGIHEAVYLSLCKEMRR